MPSSFEATAGRLIGAVTGATVIQETSNSNDVAIHADCGQITTAGVNLGDPALTEFRVINNRCTAGDLIICNHKSGGVFGDYKIRAGYSRDNYFYIALPNTVTSQVPIVLSFMIIKGSLF